MKILLLLSCLTVSGLMAQTDSSKTISRLDSIFMRSGAITVAQVREISTSDLKYGYPGEQAVYIIAKTLVRSIKFQSGRIDYFQDTSPVQPIKGLADFSKVRVTYLQSDVEGLPRTGIISAHYTSTHRADYTTEQAISMLQVEAALIGADMVLIVNQDVESTHTVYGSPFTNSSYLTGLAYDLTRPDSAAFASRLDSQRQVRVTKEICLNRQKRLEAKSTAINESFYIGKVYTRNGRLFMYGNFSGMESGEFEIISFDEHTFTIWERDGNLLYNFIISFG